MRYSTLRTVQLMIAAVSLVALLGIGLVIAQMAGYGLPLLSIQSFLRLGEGAPADRIALISGHAGFDSGAVCTDENGEVTLTEVAVNAAIVEATARRLRSARLDVLILDEYDEQQQGLEAALLLSLHSDSCIDSSGYKAARHPNSQVPAQADHFLDCLSEHYSPLTGLVYHPNTLTHDMFEYHAFRKVMPSTPAVILEMGFMGGDQVLLSTEESLIAKGITDSIVCFLEKRANNKDTL